MSSFSRRVTNSSVKFVMPDEPNSGGVGPEVKEVIKQPFSDISANLSTVIESRLAEFKRDMVKRVKRNEVEFKSKGNKKQYKHQQQVLYCLSEAKDSLASAKYEKAKKAVQEGIGLTVKRITVN